MVSPAIYMQRRPGGGDPECAPYARQAPTAMNIDLTQAITPVAATAADVNLCEDMT